MREGCAMREAAERARPTAAGRARARERRPSSACSIAAGSGAGSGPLERRIAPSRRLRVGVTEPVAGSNVAVVADLDLGRRRGRGRLPRRSLLPKGSARPTHDLRLRRPRATGFGQATKPGRAGSRGRRPTASFRRTPRGGAKGGRERRAPGLWRAPVPSPSVRRARIRRQPVRGHSARCLARAAIDPTAICASERSRSGSLPPRPRSVSRTATSAAAAPKPRSRASISMCASRGSSGSAAMARPWSVTRPSASMAPRPISR